MDQNEILSGQLDIEMTNMATTDANTEIKIVKEIEPNERASLLDAFRGAISGKVDTSLTIENEQTNLVEQMREAVIKTFNENEIENEGKTHLQMLAEKQGKQLKELPTLEDARTPDQELEFLKVLVGNINSVCGINDQRDISSSLGITPNMSLELNCMDCSMSTWVLVHEAKRKNIDIKFGSPIGHAVGIVKLSDGRTFYADGQKGFVEKIKVTEHELGKSKIIEIENYRDIQERMLDKNNEKEFFPQYVFIDALGGVSATMSNLHSMLYEQYTGELTDEVILKYIGEENTLAGSGLLTEEVRRKVETIRAEIGSMQPFAREFQKRTKDIDKDRMLDIKDELLFPDADKFRDSIFCKVDDLRRNGQRNSY